MGEDQDGGEAAPAADERHVGAGPFGHARPSMTQVDMGTRVAHSPAVTALEHLIPLPEDDE